VSAAPASDLRIAAVHVARAQVLGGAVHVIGVDSSALSGVREVGQADAVEILRATARSGDAAIIVGAFADRDQLLARLPAWGVAGIWVGDAQRPADGVATVCVAGDPEVVVPGILTLADDLRADPAALQPAIVECTDEVCITCSDEGRLGEVLAAPPVLFAPARVRTADGEEDVDVTILGHVRPGDLVLIHAGMAIASVPLPPEVPVPIAAEVMS
jgi:hypothetical protein